MRNLHTFWHTQSIIESLPVSAILIPELFEKVSKLPQRYVRVPQIQFTVEHVSIIYAA